VSKALKLTVSVVLSLAGLYYAFRKVDLVEFQHQLAGVNVGYIIMATVLMVYSVAVRAKRWQYILDPFEKAPVGLLFSSTMVGYFGNSVLPFRMGELLRGYVLSQRTSLSTSRAMGTIILERILDMLGLVILVLLFLALFPFSSWVGGILYAISAGTVVVFLIVVWLGRTTTDWRGRFRKIPFFHRPAGEKLLRIASHLVQGLTAIKNTKHALPITFNTVLLWFIYYLYMWIIVQAVGIPIDWIGVGVILIMTTLSISIPAAPGYIGTYHAVAVYALTTLFQVQLTEAQAFAVIVHAVGYLPFVILGAFYFFRSSVHLADVKGEVWS
jgi:hypothetical protein